jgi:tRNA(adenine34) deaminase
MDKIVFATADEKTGACGSVLNLLEDYKFNHVVDVEKDVMQKESEKLIKDFFKDLRKRLNNGKKKSS